MTWTRLDDGWTDRDDLDALSLAARWHYLALIQWCCRNALWDGHVKPVDARRCSRIDDPAAALAELHDAGLIAPTDDGRVRLLEIAPDDGSEPQYVPSEAKRAETVRARERKRAQRARDRERLDAALDATIGAPPPAPPSPTSDPSRPVPTSRVTSRDRSRVTDLPESRADRKARATQDLKALFRHEH